MTVIRVGLGVTSFLLWTLRQHKTLAESRPEPNSGTIPAEEMEVWLQEPTYFPVISPYDFCEQRHTLGMLMKIQSNQPLCACYGGISTARLQIYKAFWNQSQIIQSLTANPVRTKSLWTCHPKPSSQAIRLLSKIPEWHSSQHSLLIWKLSWKGK